MARHPQYTPIYSAFQGFMARCLLADRSLLWPDQEVWTIANLEQLRRRFVEGFIQGRMSFRQKLEAQLGGAPPEVWALAADSFYVYGLPSRTIRWRTKKGLVEWAAERAGLPLPPEDDPLWEPLRQGFAPTGQKYNLKHAQVRLLTLLALEVKAAPDRQWLLASPPALQALLDGLLDAIPLRIDRANDMRNAILYMAFPDEYEPLLANRDKDAVLRHYGPRLIGMPTGSLPADRDAALRKVREALQLRFPGAPQPFDFYDDLRDEWKPAPSLERAMAQQIREEQARYAVRVTRGGSHAWQSAGEDAGQTQPTAQPYSTLAQPGDSAEPSPDDAPTRPVQVARDPSAAGKQPSGAQPEGGRQEGGRPEGWRFSRAGEDDPDARRVLAALRLTRNVILAGPPGTGKTYLAERVARRLVEVPEADRPDAGRSEGAKNDKSGFAAGQPDPGRFIWWLTLHPSYAYEDFVEGLRPVISEDRPQGDNPLVEELLRQEEQRGGRNAGGKSSRPTGRAAKGQPAGGQDTGGIAYQVRPGVFRQVCELAAQDPAHPYVLVLDEINRANLSRILGELITLIEDDKRGVLSAILPYSGRAFTVPPNLILLGTMNTADRSVALLDSALRRRFAFVDVAPRPDLLANTTVETEEAVLHLDDLLRCLNAAIRVHLGRDHELGHSYFLRVVNTPPDDRLGALELVWNNQVLPLLEEYFYARRDQLAELLSPFLDEGAQDPYSQVDPIAMARLTGEDLVVALSRMCVG